MAYRAVCDCGWRGRRRDKRSDADYDVRAHEWAHGQLDNVPPLSPQTARQVAILLYGYQAVEPTKPPGASSDRGQRGARAQGRSARSRRRRT